MKIDLEPADVQRVELLLELGEAELLRAPRAALDRGREALGLAPGRASRLAVRAVTLVGSAHLMLGEVPRAIERLTEALALERNLACGTAGEGIVLARLARAHRLAGDNDRALECVEAALAIAEAGGHPEVDCESRYVRGLMQQGSGESADALVSFGAAADVAREASILSTELSARIGIAQVEARTGEQDRALERLEEVLERAHEAGLPAIRVRALLTVAHVHYRAGRGEEMLPFTEEACRIAQEFGGRLLEAEAMRVLCGAWRFRGERTRALRHAERAAAVFEEVGARPTHANMLSAVAEILVEMGELARAQGVGERVLAIAEDCQYRYGIFAAHVLLGRVHLAQGDHAAALDAAERAIIAAQATEDLQWVAAARGFALDVYQAAGDHERTLEQFRLFHEATLAAITASSDARYDLLRVRHEVAQAQREAEDARRRQRAILEQTPHVAMHAYDPNGRLRVWNAAAERTYGWVESERLDRTAEDLFSSPEEYESFRTALPEVAHGGGAFGPVEWSIRRKDETTGTTYSTLVQLVDVPGEALVVRMDLDVTEHRRAVEDLRASEALTQSVLDSLPEHVAVLDEWGVIVAVNEPWRRFGRDARTPDSAVGVGVDYLTVCRDAARSGCEDARLALAGIEVVLNGQQKTFSYEYDCSAPGARSWYRMSVTPLRADEGGVVISHADITSRKQAELELEAALADVSALKNRLEAENVYLAEEIRRDHGFGDIVGESDAVVAAIDLVARVAPTDVTVLLLGETGTGKEVFARALHAQSARKDLPLVKVDCAALPSGLIESELLGHEKGAFTGAHAAKPGRFELADRGTIFLDEIGELPTELQTKLLRVLQDGEFERLGSTRVRKTDVRVIAATNRDLARAVTRGEFRSDLYYRLNGFPIELPPLRLRTGDVALLVWHFIRRNQDRLGKKIERILQQAMDALESYTWPGNVRELFGVVERAMILSTGTTLAMPALPLLGGEGGAGTLQDAERTHILGVLEACGWRIKGRGNAAERLGLPVSTLRHRMNKLGIRRPS